MIIGAILAGGQGSRLGGDTPKQFLPLGGKPVMCHALDRMAACDRIDAIVVAVSDDRIAYTNQLLTSRSYTVPIIVIAGGHDRTETLLHILNEIDTRFGTEEDHILVSHDAARPFINQRILHDNIEAAQRYGACGTAIAAVDSMIETDDGITIRRMPDRARFYRMQTPQSFNVARLKACFAQLSETQRNALTDGCNVCVLAGQPVAIVRGSDYNLKITTPADWRLAQLIADGGLADDDL